MTRPLIRNNEAIRKISDKFKTLRRAAALKQKTVAQDTGLNIGHIEAAQVNITVSSIETLCRYYGVTLAEFFDDLDV